MRWFHRNWWMLYAFGVIAILAVSRNEWLDWFMLGMTIAVGAGYMIRLEWIRHRQCQELDRLEHQ